MDARCFSIDSKDTMKNLNQYIQEKYLIDKDTNFEPIEIPEEVKFEEFTNWLEQEFSFSKKEINTFEEKLLKESKFDKTDDFTVISYKKWGYESYISTFIQKFKDILNKDEHILISNDKYKIYFFNFRSSFKLFTLFITDSNKVLYTYLLNVIL